MMGAAGGCDGAADRRAFPGFPLTRSRFQRESASPARGEAGVSVVQDDAGLRRPSAKAAFAVRRPARPSRGVEGDEFEVEAVIGRWNAFLSMIFDENR